MLEPIDAKESYAMTLYHLLFAEIEDKELAIKLYTQFLKTEYDMMTARLGEHAEYSTQKSYVKSFLNLFESAYQSTRKHNN